MTHKSDITKQAEKELKEKKTKEKKQMKSSTTSNKKTIIVTVIVTLAILGSLGAAFKFGADYNQSINNRVHAEAKQLTATIQVPASKQ